MSNVLHDTPAIKLHQTLTMIYQFYFIFILFYIHSILYPIYFISILFYIRDFNDDLKIMIYFDLKLELGLLPKI